MSKQSVDVVITLECDERLSNTTIAKAIRYALGRKLMNVRIEDVSVVASRRATDLKQAAKDMAADARGEFE